MDSKRVRLSFSWEVVLCVIVVTAAMAGALMLPQRYRIERFEQMGQLGLVFLRYDSLTGSIDVAASVNGTTTDWKPFPPRQR